VTGLGLVMLFEGFISAAATPPAPAPPIPPTVGLLGIVYDSISFGFFGVCGCEGLLSDPRCNKVHLAARKKSPWLSAHEK